jgi:hypothetical protein
MTSKAEVLVPNKQWLIKSGQTKIGSIAKEKKGYAFLRNGQKITFKNLSEINSQFGIALFEDNIKKIKLEKPENKNYSIYDYPCKTKPFDPIYNIRNKLPLYVKNLKSKSRYCAGYYLIEFRKGWTKAYCPKLITLQRYPYQGPFKTEAEMKLMLNNLNKS